MALEITTRSKLLAYRNTVVIDSVILILDLQYINQLDRWMLSILDEAEQPIVQGIKLICGVPLTQGVIDARLPDGFLMCVRIGDTDEPPGAGELGDEVRMLWIQQADIDEARAENPQANLVTLASVRSIS